MLQGELEEFDTLDDYPHGLCRIARALQEHRRAVTNNIAN